MSAGNDSAYPRPTEYDRDGFVYRAAVHGLTKRELIAAMVLQGFSANSNEQVMTWDFEKVAEYAIKQTDALLAQLSKDQP